MERNQDQPHQVMFRHLIFASTCCRIKNYVLYFILCGVWDVLLGKSDCSIGVCSSFGVFWVFF